MMNSYHLSFLNFIIFQQEILNFFWENVFTSSDDHVFESSSYLKIPIFIHHSKIPTVISSVFVDSIFGLLLVIPVTTHNVIPSDANFSLLVPRYNVSFNINNFDFLVWNHPPDFGSDGFERVPKSCIQHQWRSFRHPISHCEVPKSHHFHYIFHQLRDHHWPWNYSGLQTRHVKFFFLQLFQKAEKHSGHSIDWCALLLLNCLDTFIPIESRSWVYDASSDIHEAEVPHHHGKAMVQRQRKAKFTFFIVLKDFT